MGLPMLKILNIAIIGGMSMLGSTEVYGDNLPRFVYISEEVRKSNLSKEEIMVQWVAKRNGRCTTSARHVVKEVSMYPNSMLLLSVIEAESKFNPFAVSKKGAVGLGQIMYKVHKELLSGIDVKGEWELFETKKNIKATSCILQMYLEMSKMNVERALYRYVGGKIKRYVNKVFANYVNLSMEIEASAQRIEDGRY